MIAFLSRRTARRFLICNGIGGAGDAPDTGPCYPGRLRATLRLIGINQEEPE